VDARFLITTPPTPILCNNCNRIILNGLEAGMPYRIDPIPINVAGELAALTEGRLTYRMIAGQIVHRAAPDMRTQPRPLVMRPHTCTPIDPSHIDTPKAPLMLAYLNPERRTTADTKEVPF
jgi:hypothetical protein